MTRPRARRRIEIGWVEAIVLVFGYVLSLGVVGLGGIYVGQRAVQQRLGAKERIFRLPIDGGPGSPNPEVAAEEPDITFYEALGKGQTRPEGRIIMPGEKRDPAPAKPAAGESAGAKATAPAEVALAPKSPDRPSARQGAASAPEQQPAAVARPPLPGFASPGTVPRPAAERLPTEGQPRAVAPPAPGLRTLPASPVESRPAGRQPAPPSDPATGSRSRESGTATNDDLEREPAPPQSTSRVTPEAAATARALLNSSSSSSSSSETDQQTGAGSWSVQVNATQERGVADRLVSDLRARGYDAFIVTQTREGAVWYRVRVGRLASLEKANALVGELKERAGLSHAFVASD